MEDENAKLVPNFSCSATSVCSLLDNQAKADVTTPEFGACIKKSGGVTSEMMDCVDVETKRQGEKLNQS